MIRIIPIPLIVYNDKTFLKSIDKNDQEINSREND